MDKDVFTFDFNNNQGYKDAMLNMKNQLQNYNLIIIPKVDKFMFRKLLMILDNQDT